MEDELAALARPTAPRLLRCAVYARVSVEDGQDKQMPSIEVQTQACRAFIEAHRHKNWLALDGVYADNGYSGGTCNAQHCAACSMTCSPTRSMWSWYIVLTA